MEHVSKITKRVLEGITVEDETFTEAEKKRRDAFALTVMSADPEAGPVEFQRQWDEAMGELEWAIELAERD